ncbi:hypothetical protein Ndes2526A_g07303 [Nannochloris sp. 'desiccata']
MLMQTRFQILGKEKVAVMLSLEMTLNLQMKKRRRRRHLKAAAMTTLEANLLRGHKEEKEDSEKEDEDEEQDALDADLAPSSDDDDDDDDDGDSEEEEEENEDASEDKGGPDALTSHHQNGNGEEPAGFLEGGKSETFARAFARIIDSSAPQTEQVLAAPILAGSKSLAARKAEDEAEAKAHRAAKKLRLEMRQRGHVWRKHNDDCEKRKVSQEAEQRLQKLGKASFLAELRNSRAAVEGGKSEAVVPSARPTSEAAAAAAGGGGDDGSDEEGGAGWDVLQKGFTGLQGGNKMKDWDKQMSEDESDGGAGEISSDDE